MVTVLEATLKLNGNQDQTLKAYIGEMIMPNFSMLLPNVVFLRLNLGKIYGVAMNGALHLLVVQMNWQHIKNLLIMMELAGPLRTELDLKYLRSIKTIN